MKKSPIVVDLEDDYSSLEKAVNNNLPGYQKSPCGNQKTPAGSHKSPGVDQKLNVSKFTIPGGNQTSPMSNQITPPERNSSSPVDLVDDASFNDSTSSIPRRPLSGRFFYVCLHTMHAHIGDIYLYC